MAEGDDCWATVDLSVSLCVSLSVCLALCLSASYIVSAPQRMHVPGSKINFFAYLSRWLVDEPA